MKHLIDLINKAIEKINSTHSLIQIVSDLDCDGIAAASIIASTLIHIDKSFQITFVNRISEELITKLKERNPELAIFTDMGSGYLDFINELKFDVIVLDHHQIEGSPADNVIHINPEEADLKLSGSGITYLLSKEMIKNNSLAPLAIVGTVGDVSYSTNSKLFETPLIEAEIGLNLFGRFSRPLYKALEFSDIPEINEESKAIQFLSEIGINPQKNGGWRTLNDLDDDEKRKLTDAIVKESLKHEKYSKKMIFSDVLTLKNFPEELKDAKEFATVLNACVIPGTDVYTNGIPIAIDNCKSGLSTFSIDNNLKIGKDVIRKIHRVRLPNKIKILEIKSSAGKKICLTENHELLTIKNGIICWKQAINLKHGDFIATPQKIEVNDFSDINFKDIFKPNEVKIDNDRFSVSKFSKDIKIPSINPDVCALIGFVIGDGHINKYDIKISFEKNEKGRQNFVKISNIFKKEFGIENFNIEDRVNSFVCTWNRKCAAEWFARMGIPRGDKSYSVCLNPKLLALNEENICGILRGLFSSDGCYENRGCVEYSTHSEKLAKQIQYLLLRIGINSTFDERFCKACKKMKYKTLIYGMDNFKLFLEKIRFISSTENSKIKIINNKLKNESLAVSNIIVELSKILKIPSDMSSHLTYYKNGSMPMKRNIKIFIDYFKNKIKTMNCALRSENINDLINGLNVSKSRFASNANLSREWLGKIMNGKKPGKIAENKLEKGRKKYKILVEEAELLLESLEKIFNSDIHWEKIKEIIEVKKRPKFVFDITSTNNPNYVANGFLIHNCANMNEPSTGLALCLGNEKALGTARNLSKAYRKIIGNYMRWIENNPESIKQAEHANYILGKDVINENFIGTIVSMLFKPVEKTLIGFGNSKDGIKVSGRSKNVNIREMMVEAAKSCGGRGGGHEQAAGAMIPSDTQEKFIELCENLLKEKLIKI